MSRCWLALVAEQPERADAVAWVSAEGAPIGALAAWFRRGKPVREARRVDPRIVDPAGAPAHVSLVLPPAGVRLPFDDLAVQQARRAVLARPPFDAVSTLMRDSSYFEGAVTVARGEDVERLDDEPFARLFDARVLEVGAGLFGSFPAPAGPTIERYGSAEPWPWDRFLGPDQTPSK